MKTLRIIQSIPLTGLDVLHRWAGARVLQQEISQALAGASPGSAAHRTSQIASFFSTVFHSRQAMEQFHHESASVQWAAGSPWPDLERMAEAVIRSGSLRDSEAGSDAQHPLLHDLRETVARAWEADTRGFTFVYQQEVRSGLWTSIPLRAEEAVRVQEGVHAGWLQGFSRWAVRLSAADDNPCQFMVGLNRQGSSLAASAVETILKATILHEPLRGQPAAGCAQEDEGHSDWDQSLAQEPVVTRLRSHDRHAG